MIYRVLLAEQAKRDLRGIYEYFAFTRQEPWKSMGLRQVFAGSYCVFYLVTENSVQVTRIMYGGMDLSAELNETAFDD